MSTPSAVAEFAVGDVVVLKSGGPHMTITDLMDEDLAYCQWMDDKKMLQGSRFGLRTIKKVETEGSSLKFL